MHSKSPLHPLKLTLQPQEQIEQSYRALLAALEADAAAAGADWMILQTAYPQVAAVALYRSSGYTEIESFGYYAESDDVLNLGRSLSRSMTQRPGSI